MARRLLFAYADRDKLAQFEKLRKQIGNALTCLQAFSSKDWIERVLCEALKNPPESRPDVAPAAATLVNKNHWFTDTITEALLDALPNDSEQWNKPFCLMPSTLCKHSPKYKYSGGHDITDYSASQSSIVNPSIRLNSLKL